MRNRKRLPNVLEALDLYASRWFRAHFEELAEKKRREKARDEEE